MLKGKYHDNSGNSLDIDYSGHAHNKTSLKMMMNVWQISFHPCVYPLKGARLAKLTAWMFPSEKRIYQHCSLTKYDHNQPPPVIVGQVGGIVRGEVPSNTNHQYENTVIAYFYKDDVLVV